MIESLTSADLTDVPVFPLPRVVFFPRTILPLRIFEPRYRAMMAACLQTEERLLVVAQLQPGFESDYQGRPPIYDVAGLGRIDRYQEHADGTYSLTLEGLARVRLSELPAIDTPFRRAALLPLQEREPQGGVAAAELSAVLSLADQVTRQLQAEQPSFELALGNDRSPGALADRLAGQLLIDPTAAQEALEILAIDQRLRFIMDQLAQLHMALSKQAGSETLLH